MSRVVRSQVALVAPAVLALSLKAAASAVQRFGK